MKVRDYDHREELLYHPEFCWVKPEEDIVICGLTDFFCKLAGEISYIDMPGEGDEIKMGERIGTVETGKWVGKLIAPVTGEIVEVNEDVDDDPAIVNEEPYENWIFKVKLADAAELDKLLKGPAAVEWLEKEIDKQAK
jgi:glycine cleavage system H protein